MAGVAPATTTNLSNKVLDFERVEFYFFNKWKIFKNKVVSPKYYKAQIHDKWL